MKAFRKMEDKLSDKNQVSIVGEVVSGFTFSHEVFGEGFYLLDVKVNRLSDFYDVIPIMVSDRLIDIRQNYVGQYIEVNGQFRSYNPHEKNKSRRILSVFVRELVLSDEPPVNEKLNYIFLDGFICKSPIYRKTPLGREITEILLAVNRPCRKSDYIPCICWGRNARIAENFTVGGHLQIWGRIQSREYQKKLSEERYETRTTYEVSVNKLEYLLNV